LGGSPKHNTPPATPKFYRLLRDSFTLTFPDPALWIYSLGVYTLAPMGLVVPETPINS